MIAKTEGDNLDNVLSALHRVLDRHPEVEMAVLFGSVAAGAAGPKSDIDLAIRLGPVPNAWKLGELAIELEEATGKRADIVLMEGARSALLRREMARGILVKGNAESWVEFRRQAFREWREFGPRFRRLSDLLLHGSKYEKGRAP